ncbi:hypothetical protein ES705_23402 [subsurface metagenome]
MGFLKIGLDRIDQTADDMRSLDCISNGPGGPLSGLGSYSLSNDIVIPTASSLVKRIHRTPGNTTPVRRPVRLRRTELDKWGRHSIIGACETRCVSRKARRGKIRRAFAVSAAALCRVATARPSLAKNNITPLLERHEQLNDNDKAGAAAE